MAKNNYLVIGIIAALVLVVAGVIQIPTDWFSSGSTDVGGACEIAPTVSTTVVNGVNTGTAVYPTYNYTRVGDNYMGTGLPSAFEKGATGEVVFAAANYINSKVTLGPLKCGTNVLSGKLYATDDSTLKVFNDVGQVVTDNAAGGATNQSASATTINQEIKIIANADQFSGDLVCVVESSNTTETAEMIIGGATKVAVPKFYTLAGATSVAEAYEIPGLYDGDSKVYNLKITPESGKTLGAVDDNAIYLTCYSKQWFVDTDGTFKYGVENADGTSQAEDDFDYDWLIA